MSGIGPSSSTLHQPTLETSADLSSQSRMTEIRKLADNFPEAPVYRAVLAILDWDNLERPHDESFIDEAVAGFEALKDPNTNVRSWLARWSALVHDRLKGPSGPASVSEDPSVTAQGVFKYLLYGAEVADVDREVATLISAAVATSEVKKTFRLHRIAEAKTHESRAVFALKRTVKNDPHKLPLQVSVPFDGPSTVLPYTMFRTAMVTARKFDKLTEDEMVVYLFRNLSPGLGLDIMTDIGEADATLTAIWSALDERYASMDTPSGVAARWERLYMRTGENVSDFCRRVRNEAHLFRSVTGVVLTPGLVAARFLGGLRKELRASLESVYMHRLSSLTLEEVREELENKDRRGSPDPSVNRRDHTKKPKAVESHTEAPAVTGKPSSSCGYCLEHNIKGADKHTRDTCWKDPANSAIVPAWYKLRPKGKADGADGKTDGKVFFPKGSSLRYLKGTAAGVGIRLVIDTGADYTIMSRQAAEDCRVSHLELLSEPILIGSLSSSASLRLSEKGRLQMSVEGESGHCTTVTIYVYLVDGELLHESLRKATVLLGMGTLSRMRASIDVGRDTLTAHELGVVWPLFPTGVDSYGNDLPVSTAPCSDMVPKPEARIVEDISIPDEETISTRLRTWQWPKVHVEMKTTAVPPARRDPYPCEDIERKAMQMLVAQLERDGFVETIALDEVRVWVVPAFIVEKHCAEVQPSFNDLTDENVQKHFRLVVDERPINECCKPLPSTWEGYQLPLLHCIESIGANSWFATLDIKNAYFCLEYHPSVQRFFAFSYFDHNDNIRYALHRRMIMRCTHSASYWCYALRRLLDLAVPEILPYMVSYMDDCLVWHPDRSQCEAMLQAVLFAIRTAGAEAPPHKVKGPCREVEFLGMRLGPDGYCVADHTLRDLRSALSDRPKTLRGLRVKLGLMQFCKSLWSPVTGGAVGTLTHLTEPLTALIGELTSRGARRNARLHWTPELDEVWADILRTMKPQTIGFHAASEASDDIQFVLASDASPIAAAAVLYAGSRRKLLSVLNEGLKIDSEWLGNWGRVIGIWTHRWSKAERRYDIIDKELFGLTKSLLHWRHRILETVLRPRFQRRGLDDDHEFGRVLALTDSSAALGRFLARNSYVLKPQGSRDRRWLGWLADLSDFPEVDLSVCHVGGHRNRLSDILSRLLPDGNAILAEGNPRPLALAAPVVAEAEGGEIPSSRDDVHQLMSFLDNASEFIIDKQKAGDSTKVHGATLATWCSYFLHGEADDLPSTAAAALNIGLVRWKPGVFIVRDAVADDIIWSLVIPLGSSGDLPGLLSTNYLPGWGIREWVSFVFHDLSCHQGVDGALEALVRHFWWPGCGKALREWSQTCDRCLENRKNTRLHSIPCLRIPRGLTSLDERGKHLALDFGYIDKAWIPANDSGYVGFLCMVCIATGFTMITPVKDMKSGTAVREVIKLWTPILGFPKTITADNAITSEEFCTEMTAVGVRVCKIPSFSPWANGIAEKRVGTVKARLAGMRIPWNDALSWVQLTINSSVNAIGVTPSELMLGMRIRHVADVVSEPLSGDAISCGDDPSQLALNTYTSRELAAVLTQCTSRVRLSLVHKHAADAVRRMAAATGRLPVDGELVVWHRPECLPIEGHVRLVHGPNLNDGPFVYLNSQAGQVVMLEPLGADHL
ncbi:hypothetical protein FOL47_005778, partial [Perkinsus chesapeaki]